MSVRNNRKLLGLFFIFLLTAFAYFNHTPRICVIAEIDLKHEFILTVSPLTIKELDLARRSLQLIKEIDPSQHYDGVENIEVHWMRSTKFVGITVYRNSGGVIVILDESLKIKNEKNPWEYVRFGAIYSHELSHAINGTKDPHTEQITDVRIWSLLRSNEDLTKMVSKWNP
jgi:hypothetical protein